MQPIKMKRWALGLTTAAVVMLTIALPADAKRGGEGGRGDGPVVYVTSQGKYFDSIVTADPLPPHGPFQLLYMGPNGLTTDAGPGDRDYVGGRWWMDVNGNGEQDEGDHFFSCPLQGPGRDAP